MFIIKWLFLQASDLIGELCVMMLVQNLKVPNVCFSLCGSHFEIAQGRHMNGSKCFRSALLSNHRFTFILGA